jgi:Bacterial Ig-like domain (group 3)
MLPPLRRSRTALTILLSVLAFIANAGSLLAQTQRQTTTTVMVPPVSFYGQTNVSASVVGVPDPLAPGSLIVSAGSVSFFVDDNPVPFGIATVHGGVAMLPPMVGPAIPVGAHTLKAVYQGSLEFAGSASQSQTFSVSKIATHIMPLMTSTVAVGTNATLSVHVMGGAFPVHAGTVTFSDGPSVLGSGPVGMPISLMTSNLAAGQYPISVVYSGADNFESSVSSFQLTVGAMPPPVVTSSVTLMAPSTVAVGQSISLSALVHVTGGGPAAGTVTFKDGPTPLATIPVAGGMATYPTGPLTAGPHTFSAVFDGGAGVPSATSMSVLVTVTADTGPPTGQITTTMLSLPPTVSVGQPAVFSASVMAPPTPMGPPAMPVGNVVFRSSGGTVFATVPVMAGIATYTHPGFAVAAPQTIIAEFQGGGGFQPSTSMPMVLTVTGGSAGGTDVITMTMLTAPGSVSSGDPVTLSATVHAMPGPNGPPPGMLTGSVTFRDGGISIGTAPLTGTTAMLTLPSLPAGPHTITADYTGGPGFQGSTSPPAYVNVGSGGATTPSITTLSVPPSASTGQSVLMTATVSVPGAVPPAPMLSGTITFRLGAISLATLPLTGNSVTFAATSLPPGPHTLIAEYSGGGTVQASMSPPASISVTGGAATGTGTTTLMSAIPPTAAFQPVTLTAFVTPAPGAPPAPLPGGNVTFRANGGVLGTAPLMGPSANFTVPGFAIGSYSISAEYQGDASFQASVSPPFTLSVTGSGAQTPTMTILVAHPNQLVAGQPTTLTATVSPIMAGAPPNGNVTFRNGPVVLGTASLTGTSPAGPTAMLTVPGLAIGSHMLTATYDGSPAHMVSTGTAPVNVQNTVMPATPAWQVTALADVSNFTVVGQQVRFEFALRNMGSVPINAISLLGTNTGRISCDMTALAPNAVTSCYSTYYVTAANIGTPLAYRVRALGTVSTGVLPIAEATGALPYAPPAANAAWTLEGNASRHNFSAAGQSISFTFLLANTGGAPISAIQLTGVKTGPVTCPSTTLPTGATMTCTSRYTTTTADLNADLQVSIAATGTSPSGPPQRLTGGGPIQFIANPTANWTFDALPSRYDFSAEGQVITYAYTVVNTGDVRLTGLSVAGTKIGTVTCNTPALAPGQTARCTSSYTVTAADLGSDLQPNATAVVSTGTFPLTKSRNGTIRFGATQATWTLSAAASTSAFNGTGQTIAYNFRLANTGTAPISGIRFTSAKAGPIACPARALVPGASMTCTSSYVTTGSDIGGNIAFAVTAIGTVANGTLADVRAEGVVTFPTQAGWRIVATPNVTSYSARGQSIGYNFGITNTGNAPIRGLRVTGTKVGAITCPDRVLDPGETVACSSTYVTSAADVGTAITYAVNASGILKSGTIPAATANGSIGYQLAAKPVASTATAKSASVAVAVPTPDPSVAAQQAEATRVATTAAIRGFMGNRVEILAASAPDMSQGHSRLTAPMFGGPVTADQAVPTGGLADARAPVTRSFAPALPLPSNESSVPMARRTTPAPFMLNGATDDGTGRFEFSTSLSQVRTAALAEQARREAEGVAPGTMGLTSTSRAAMAAAPRFDIWAKGSFSYFTAENLGFKQQGQAGLFSAGADYLVTPGLLLGVLVQSDWVDQAQTGSTANGLGWMAGPYMSARLTSNIYFDARVLRGRSNNQVDALGLEADGFETTRTAAFAKLSGVWNIGPWLLRPSADFAYVAEQQAGYTTGGGVAIDSQTIALGRVTAGPEVGYRIGLSDGGLLEPFVGVKGVWDFVRTDGLDTGPDALRARLEAGASVRLPSGVQLRAAGAYDGVGGTVGQGWSGRGTFVMPLP